MTCLLAITHTDHGVRLTCHRHGLLGEYPDDAAAAAAAARHQAGEAKE